MMIPLNLRSVLAVFTVLIIVFVVFFKRESKGKNDYEHLQGRVTFVAKRLGALPNRDFGKYRYIAIDTYPYPFELYSEEPKIAVDSLNAGDTVTAYFYEEQSTISEQLNRHLIYLETNNKLIYKDGDFKKTMALGMIVFILLSMAGCYILYKKGKIPY